MRLSVLSLLFLITAQTGFAKEHRLERLIDLIGIQGQFRDWSTQLTDDRMHYTCTTCDKTVEAYIHVISPYKPETYGTVEKRYLAERKILCSKLLITGGRCVGTKQTELRGGALRGFKSEMAFQNRTEIETVFFYAGPPTNRPEMIRSVISVEKGGLCHPILTTYSRTIWPD
ncbi:hypothetical protein [Pseudaestuariivita rosea]|uniref:hypothetical protein n=1 Tax=Pseudaestuariivita rosea TaxID=2763263 RepID=UPI001ABB2BF9|nr:hypothetical protein [Pseudaestuariivita rosea]